LDEGDKEDEDTFIVLLTILLSDCEIVKVDLSIMDAVELVNAHIKGLLFGQT